MVRLGKRLTISLALRIKSSNKKQKARFSITAITHKDFRKMFKKFDNPPYPCYKSEKVNNGPTEAYFFLIKQSTKLMEYKRRIRPKFVKLGINKTIVHVNKAIQSK